MIRLFKNFEDEENWRKNSVPKLIAAYNELFGAWDKKETQTIGA